MLIPHLAARFKRPFELLKKFGPVSTRPKTAKGDNMKDINRVLARRGARDLDEKEVEQVAGGLRTTTKCSLVASTRDGDVLLGEC